MYILSAHFLLGPILSSLHILSYFTFTAILTYFTFEETVVTDPVSGGDGT